MFFILKSRFFSITNLWHLFFKQLTFTNILAIVAILVAVLQIFTSKYFAEISGAFDRPILRVSFGSLPLNPTDTTQVIYGTHLDNNKNCLTLGALPIVLSNFGEKTLESPVVVVRTHKILKREGLNILKYIKEGPFQSFLIKKNFFSDEVFDYVSYSFEKLNPGMNAGINEPFVAIDTNVDFEAHLKTKDGVGLAVSGRVGYSNQYLISVTARDLKTINYALDVAITSAEDIESLTSFAVKNFAINDVVKFRKNFTFIGYLLGLIFHNEQKSLMLIYQQTKRVGDEDGLSVLIAKDYPAIRRISYNLFSWKYLF